MSDLPPGFVLDQSNDNNGLPPGFTLDAPAAPKESLLSDAAKSAGAGLANATAGVLGAAGDARELASKATDYVGNKLGISPDKVQTFKNAMQKAAAASPIPGVSIVANAPTSRQVIDSAKDPIVSPDYQPQTTLGGVLKTGAELAPAIADPELATSPNTLRTLGRLALTHVAAPAVASETAGELTKGTAAEPYARVAAAIAGGVAGPKALQAIEGAAAARAAKAAVPTAEDLKASYRSAIDHPDVTAVQIKPQAASDLATTIENDLVKQGFRDRAGQGGTVFDTIRELKNAPGPISVQDVDSVRKALRQVGKSGIPTPDSAAAKAAIDHIDDFLPNLKQSDVLAGDAAKAGQIMTEARGNYAAAKRSDMLNSKIDAAELQAASANSGHNVENALRQRVRSILTSPKLSRGLNGDEKLAMEAFVRGNTTGNVMRHVGNVLGGGGGLGHLLTAGAGAVTAGLPGAIVAPLAGTALKGISNAMAMKRVRDLDVMLRSRSPDALRIARQTPPQLLRALPKQSAAILAAMSADPTLTQPQQQPVQQMSQ